MYSLNKSFRRLEFMIMKSKVLPLSLGCHSVINEIGSVLSFNNIQN